MPNANVTIKADDKTRAAFEKADSRLKKFDDRGKDLSNRFSILNAKTLAYTAAVAGLTVTAKKAIGAFTDYESQMFRIEALLKSTGSAAGLTADEIDAMSRRIGADTLASANDVRDAAGILLTFKSVSEGAFTRTIELSQDMAAVMGTNVKNSVLQLAKALEEPIIGLSALRRSGVSFNETQKEMIKALVESGEKAEAQGIILDTLEQQLGGAGAGEGKGVAGAADLATENLTKFLEALGKSSGAASAAGSIYNTLAGALEWYAGMLDPSDEERLAKALKNKTSIINQLNHELIENNGIQIGVIDRLQKALKAEEDIIESSRLRIEIERVKKEQANEASIAVQEASEKEQQQIIKTNELKKKAAEDEKQRQAEIAESFSNEREFEALSRSLMTQEQAINDHYLNRRLSLESLYQDGVMSAQEYYTMLTTLEDQHNQQSMALMQAQASARLNAISATMTNLSSLMNTENRRLFQIGKAASIAAAIINTHQAITKTMASVPYPFNIPLAAAQGVAGFVQVDNIRRQQYSGARVHGGPVLAGELYRINENGDEYFRPNVSGSIISNRETNNNSNINLTVHQNIMANSQDDILIELRRSPSQTVNALIDVFRTEGIQLA